MTEIKSKLKTRRSAYKVEIKGRLELPFEVRRQRRYQAKLASGEEVAVTLPHGEILRGGDLVAASDGRVIEIVSQSEKILEAKAKSASELARIAYRLGERHVPVEVGEGYLRIAEDPALEKMLEGLGATISRTTAPFEPEAGAHGAGHEHGTGKAHDHEPQHEHRHGPGCGHDHHH